MAATYFYDPRLKQTEDGYFEINVFKHTKKENILVDTISYPDYKAVLRQAQDVVNTLNSKTPQGKHLRKIYS